MRIANRRLDWPDCRNARDLGGLPTRDGGRIRRGALIRADCLDRLTGEGMAAVRAYGVSRVIDLRTSGEIAHRPGPFTGDPIHHEAPLIDEVADRHRDPVAEATMVATYRGSVIRNAHTIAAGLAAVADAPPGGVVVHCHAGKDRTGMHVALALRVVGVSIDDVAADYALTTECLREQYEADLAAVPDEASREVLRELQSSRPETIISMLEHVEDRYGSVAQYLIASGLSRRQLAALRQRLRDG